MAITPRCDICDQELQDYGAILLSPPVNGKVDKFHICTLCYAPIRQQIKKSGQTEAKITTDNPKR